jgi:hypothetical protein
VVEPDLRVPGVKTVFATGDTEGRRRQSGQHCADYVPVRDPARRLCHQVHPASIWVLAGAREVERLTQLSNAYLSQLENMRARLNVSFRGLHPVSLTPA